MILADGEIETAFHWISPPVQMLSTSAGALAFVFEEMSGHASNRNYRKFMDAIASRSTDVLKLRMLDGAFSNNRYSTREILEAQFAENVFFVAGHCFINANNLVAVAVTKASFQQLCHKLYVACKWLNMGSYCLRTIYSVQSTVRQKLKVVPGSPDAGWQRVGNVIIGLNLGFHKTARSLRSSLARSQACTPISHEFLARSSQGRWLSMRTAAGCTCALDPIVALTDSPQQSGNLSWQSCVVVCVVALQCQRRPVGRLHRQRLILHY